jgi:hypothetical protein
MVDRLLVITVILIILEAVAHLSIRVARGASQATDIAAIDPKAAVSANAAAILGHVLFRLGRQAAEEEGGGRGFGDQSSLVRFLVHLHGVR